MSGDVYWDLDITWDIGNFLRVTLGGRNLFDAAPDPQPDFFSCCGITAHENSVMDWQGTYYYLRGVLSWH